MSALTGLLGAASDDSASGNLVMGTVTTFKNYDGGGITLPTVSACKVTLDGALSEVTVQIPATTYAYPGARVQVARIGRTLYIVNCLGEPPWANCALAAGCDPYPGWAPPQIRRIGTLVETRGLVRNNVALAVAGVVVYIPLGMNVPAGAPELGPWYTSTSPGAMRYNIVGATSTLQTEQALSAGYVSLKGVSWRTN